MTSSIHSSSHPQILIVYFLNDDKILDNFSFAQKDVQKLACACVLILADPMHTSYI